MRKKYKDILSKKKKVCAICNVGCYNDGIKIVDTCICENCIDKITLLSCKDKRYDIIKDNIKATLVKSIIF